LIFSAFQPDRLALFVAIEVIHPEFVEEIVGWQHEELLIEEGWEPILVFGSGDLPIDWMPTRRSPITPRPIIEKRLVWKKAI
jgi:hypothetical protein